jgi:hypothetical protein
MVQTTHDGTEYAQPPAGPAAPAGPATKAEVTPAGNGAFSVACSYADGAAPVMKTATSVDELAAVLGESFGVASQVPAGAASDVETY